MRLLPFRKFCELDSATSWSSSPAEITQNLWKKLSELYTSPNDIDLFSAGLAETHAPGAEVGPTFACIMGQQVQYLLVFCLVRILTLLSFASKFRALKDGDRFFFTHTNGGNPFTAQQLDSIRVTYN